MVERKITVENNNLLSELCGYFDENIKLIEKSFNTVITLRDTEIKVSGEEKDVVSSTTVIDKIISMIEHGEAVSKQSISYIVSMIEDDEIEEAQSYSADFIAMSATGVQIKSKTYAQKQYVEAIRKNDITFAIGPAGTGKTFLAVAMAVNAFKNKEVNRIILTRPAVEGGEKLGFLPGDLQNKVDPYLRPLYDALYYLMGGETYQAYIEKGTIEVAPLAYMRGRTLDDAFIILDEAQNTTIEQMKMFLTRTGIGSKAVITGDITQIDLPPDKKSGLKEISKILNKVDGIKFITLTEKDVVRHELVQKIIKAFDRYEKGRPSSRRRDDKPVYRK